jgi:zinc-RING finger domain
MDAPTRMQAPTDVGRMQPPTAGGLVGDLRTVIVPFGSTCSSCFAPVEDGENHYVAPCGHLFCVICADSDDPITCGVCQAVFTFEEAEMVDIRVSIPNDVANPA